MAVSLTPLLIFRKVRVHLFAYWGFWLGIILVIEALIILFMMGQYKRRRIQAQIQREIRTSIRKTHRAKRVGHLPCRFDRRVWHAGKCTQFACPSAHNHPKMGAVHAHR